jgi:hypothetical protein
MKILLDVSRELFNGERVPCAGVKLQEQPHGHRAQTVDCTAPVS